ncbi:MAG TPA: hypothetical protein VK796_05970 [Cytophaga sp.]|jgi:hypothetical protein|nr:hypothetical protein [Cytophaga sp.]
MRYVKYMNYIITASFILLFCISGKAQSDSISVTYSLLGESEDKSVSVYVGKYNYHNLTAGQSEGAQSFYEIIMIVHATRDTCVIATSDYVTTYIDSMNIKSIVLDKSLRKGILLTLYLHEHSNLGEHGDYDIHKTVNEIWDLKTERKIFSAINKFHFTADNYSYFEDDSSSVTRYTDYTYAYDFYFVSIEIVINNIKIECAERYNNDTEWTSISEAHVGYVECQLPEHKEGIYFYRKGKYILKKER